MMINALRLQWKTVRRKDIFSAGHGAQGTGYQKNRFLCALSSELCAKNGNHKVIICKYLYEIKREK
jgi:hypothetical protein